MTLLSLALAAHVVAADRPVLLPQRAGAEVYVSLDRTITTRTARAGDAVGFHIVDDVDIDGRFMPRGTRVTGVVLRAKRAGRFHGAADLAIGDLTIASADGTPLARSGVVITAMPRRHDLAGFYARQTASEGAVLTGMAAGYGGAWLASQWSHSEDTIANVGLLTGVTAIALVKILPRGEDLQLSPGGALAVTFTAVGVRSNMRSGRLSPQ